MTATITVKTADVGSLKGVKGIDILVDGKVVRTTTFGRVESIECEPGDHRVQVVLRAVVTRKSRELPVSVADGRNAALTASYSKLWGSISLKS